MNFGTLIAVFVGCEFWLVFLYWYCFDLLQDVVACCIDYIFTLYNRLSTSDRRRMTPRMKMKNAVSTYLYKERFIFNIANLLFPVVCIIFFNVCFCNIPMHWT